MNKLDNAGYEKSNKIEAVTLNKFDKSYMTKLLNASDLEMDRQKKSQALLDYLCDKFKMPKCRVTVTKVPQPHATNQRGSLKSKEYGHYVPLTYEIVVYNVTAVRQQKVAIKTFMDTLLHEFIHHYDMTYLKLGKSPHTAGFYKRISDLKAKLV